MKKILVALAVAFVGIIIFFLWFTQPKPVRAWEDNDGWSTCVSNKECGTDNGTQTKVVSTSPTLTCPDGYHLQNDGFFGQRCHRTLSCSHYPQGQCPTEHVNPGHSCPEGYTLDDNSCKKTITRDCHTRSVFVCDDNTGGQDATPSATPTPEPQSSGGSSSNSTPAADNPVCTVGVSAPLLQGFKLTSPTSVFWSWWPSLTGGLDKQWVEYGYEKGNYPYNVTVNTDVTGFEIGAMDPNAPQHWARVCVQKGGCVACSNDLDP